MLKIEVERWLPDPGNNSSLRDVELTIGKGQLDVGDIRPGSAGHGRLAMPAPVNAHDHGYGIRPLDFGLVDDALEPWIAGLRQRPATDPYLEALVAFGRTAMAGCGATMHCHNSLNADRLVEEAGAVARAAADCGTRLGLSCPLLDDSPFVYGGPERLAGVLDAEEYARVSSLVPAYSSIELQLDAVAAIADAHAGPLLDVQYGPIGPQWCSDRLLERIAEESMRTGRRIHMHLLESPRQRAWLDKRFPEGVVRHLDRIGFLSDRLAVAHGVQLRQDECELLAERGVVVATNPTANLRLCSGTAPVDCYQKSGLRFAIGMDGTGFDDNQDIWQEIRLLWLLHGGRKLERQVDAASLYNAAIGNGAIVVGQKGGIDVVVVDFAALTADSVFDDVSETDILTARMSGTLVTDLIVDGRFVVRDRKLTGFDFEAARCDLRDQARANANGIESARRDAQFLSKAIRQYYLNWEFQPDT